MNDALKRLLNKRRPFLPFEFDGDSYLARAFGVAENAQMQLTCDTAYENKLASLRSGEAIDSVALRRLLEKEPAEKLADFIGDINRTNIMQDARRLYDDAPPNDARVVQKTEELVLEYKAELVAKNIDELREIALEQREHFVALFERTRVRRLMLAILGIYTPDEQPLFGSLEEAELLPQDDLEALIAAGLKVLNPEKPEDKAPDPLPSADSNASAEPPPSPTISEAAPEPSSTT